MKRLIIISDLWGGKQPTYIQKYLHLLDQKFELQYYDACALGEIDQSDFTEKNIHQQFVNGGIDMAVENLLQAEDSKVSILGFSIGGVIAWKAIQQGLNCDALLAVSSTRLRYESERLTCPTQLIFGKLDPFKPKEKWFKMMNITYKLFDNQGHEFYKNESIVDWIAKELLNEPDVSNDSPTIV